MNTLAHACTYVHSGVLVKAVDSWRLSTVLHRKREKREKSMDGGGFCAGEVFTSKTEPGPVSEQSFREVRWIRDNGRTIVTIDRGIARCSKRYPNGILARASLCA